MAEAIADRRLFEDTDEVPKAIQVSGLDVRARGAGMMRSIESA